MTVQKNDADNKRFSLVTIPRSRNGSELSVANYYNLAKARIHAENILHCPDSPVTMTMTLGQPPTAFAYEYSNLNAAVGVRFKGQGEG